MGVRLVRENDRSAAAPSRRNSDRQRRAFWTGFALSAAVHLLLLFGWRSAPQVSQGSLAAGPRTGDYRAAAGGGDMVAINIAPPRPIEVPAPPSTQPRLRDPEVAVSEPEQQMVAASLSAPGGGQGDRSGPGLSGADGAGDGGTDRQGRDRRSFPTPRSIIPRWNPPDELKGQRVTFRVRVDETGEPTGEIEIRPRVGETAFMQKVREDLLNMDYLPGRRDGRPVPDWAEMTLTF